MKKFNDISNDELLEVDGGCLFVEPATALWVGVGLFTVGVVAAGVYFCCRDEYGI